jgi:hypothetical protein
MRWLYIGLGVVAGVIAVLAGIGYAMPNVHVAQIQAEYRASPDSVYVVLSDIESWPDWHPSVETLTPIGDEPEQPSYRISGPDGSMTITVTGREPPRRFTTLADGGMFIGRWTYAVDPVGSGSRVTLTEEARIDNLVVRGLTVFRSPTATMERLLRGLGARLGQPTVEPRRLN